MEGSKETRSEKVKVGGNVKRGNRNELESGLFPPRWKHESSIPPP